MSSFVILYNHTGDKILCLERDPNDPSFTGWCLPGGKQDPEDNGDIMVTALRELQEEAGIPTSAVTVVGVLPVIHSVSPKSQREYTITPVVAILKGPVSVTLSEEHVDYMWGSVSAWLNPKNAATFPLAGAATRFVLESVSQKLLWPLRDTKPLFPDAPGRFGTNRSTDIHTGVDLYCERGTIVQAMCSGTVVAVECFTGSYVGTKHRPKDQYNDGDPNAAQPPSPWWNDTEAVLVRSDYDGSVILYGELATDIEVGTHVSMGQELGIIKRAVLRSNKGRPMTMCHLEWHDPGSLCSFGWDTDQPQPAKLRNPEPLLFVANVNQIAPEFDLTTYDGKRFIDPSAPCKPSKYWAVWQKPGSPTT